MLWGAVLAFSYLMAILRVFLMKPYLVEGFVVPTASMSPTIDPRDRVFGNKLLSPHRFDLVLYHANNPPENPIYVKRLIALPGERLRFESGDLYINNQKLQVPDVIKGKCRATLGTSPGNFDRYRDGQTIQLGPDEYFFLGDHTEMSLDAKCSEPIAEVLDRWRGRCDLLAAAEDEDCSVMNNRSSRRSASDPDPIPS